MLPFKNKTLSGWGNFPKQACAVFRPERQRDISAVMGGHGSSLIGRGMGRSYGDAALNWEGVVSMERMNRFLYFDTENGIISAQAGVTLREILEIAVPKGWFLPVLPGTQFATLGGAVAANVHGKNAFRMGEISRHVLNLVLKTPQERMLVAHTQEPEVFRATLGGMGMTGIIEEVTLQLIPIASGSLQKETFRTHTIVEMLQAFRQRATSAEYMVGWIDHFATGRQFGQGVFESAVHQPAMGGLPLSRIKPEPTPKPFPGNSLMLNGLTMRLYNQRRFGKYTDQPKQESCSFAEFFHPLDRYSDWNKLYGSKGFLQYQFILPEGQEVAAQMQHILQVIQNAGAFSYLAVIKMHGPTEAMLGFSMPGFSVALDFNNTPKILTLLEELDKLVLQYQGRVYLAKDARMRPDTFARMYGTQLEAWRHVLHQLDPERKCQSAMSRRLHFRGEGAL